MRYERPIVQSCRLSYRHRSLLDRLLGRQYPSSVSVVVTTPAGHLAVYEEWVSGPYGKFALAHKERHGEWPTFAQIHEYATAQVFDREAADRLHFEVYG